MASHYYVNVAQLCRTNGEDRYVHVFGTAEHSITNEQKCKFVYRMFKKKFPEPEYKVDVTWNEDIGKEVDTAGWAKDE